MDLLTARERVRDLTGIRSVGVLSDAGIDRYINEAANEIYASADWPFLRETLTAVLAAGDSEATLTPSNVAHRVVDVFAVVNGGQPFQVHERTSPLLASQAATSVREFDWVASTSTLRVYPAASSEVELTVRLVVEPVDVVADTDEFAMPDRFSSCVPFLAAARVLEREGDTSERGSDFVERAWRLASDMRRVLMTSSRTSAVLGGRSSRRRSRRMGV